MAAHKSLNEPYATLAYYMRAVQLVALLLQVSQLPYSVFISPRLIIASASFDFLNTLCNWQLSKGEMFS